MCGLDLKRTIIIIAERAKVTGLKRIYKNRALQSCDPTGIFDMPVYYITYAVRNICNYMVAILMGGLAMHPKLHGCACQHSV